METGECYINVLLPTRSLTEVAGERERERERERQKSEGLDHLDIFKATNPNEKNVLIISSKIN